MVLSVSNTVKPLWQNSKATRPKDDLFAAIDDYSRELYAFRPMQNHRHGQTVNQAKKQPALPFSKCRLLFGIFNGHAPGFVGLKEWVWRRYAMRNRPAAPHAKFSVFRALRPSADHLRIGQRHAQLQAPITRQPCGAVYHFALPHQHDGRRYLHLPCLRPVAVFVVQRIERPVVLLQVIAHFLSAARAQRHAQHGHAVFM